MTPNTLQTYITTDGRLTLSGLTFFSDLERRLSEAEATIAAIKEIAAPTGGATQDAEARAAIAAILGA